MTPKRIQRSRKAGSKLPPNTLVVTRGQGNPFANPFQIGGWFKIGNGKPGGFTYMRCLDEKYATPEYVQVLDRAHAVEMFREYRRLYPLNPKEIQRIREADYLACWCPVDGLPCHADVLIELARA